MVRRNGDRRRQADGASARNSFHDRNLRWCRASRQRPCWRNSAIDRLWPDLAAHHRYRERCSSGLRPSDPARLVIAAAAVGLCISRDAGATWTIEQRGLHAPHCSAVAFGRNDILVSASTAPFAAQGAVYRRPIDSNGPLQPLDGGMPEVDRRQSRHRLHRDRWFNGRHDRLIRTSLRVS